MNKNELRSLKVGDRVQWVGSNTGSDWLLSGKWSLSAGSKGHVTARDDSFNTIHWDGIELPMRIGWRTMDDRITGLNIKVIDGEVTS